MNKPWKDFCHLTADADGCEVVDLFQCHDTVVEASSEQRKHQRYGTCLRDCVTLPYYRDITNTDQLYYNAPEKCHVRSS